MDEDRLYPGVQLSRLLNRSQFFRADDIHVQSCCVDHRRCRSGDLYVALVDADGDGHDYAQDAVGRGAAALLCERLLPVDVPQCIVPNSRAAFGKLCHALAGDPSRRLRTIGVAGSHGKTSTQLLLATSLEQNSHRPAVFGSLGSSDGLEACPRNEGEPNAARIATWLAEAAANGCTQAIAEMPQRYAVGGHFTGMRMDIALLTGFHATGPLGKSPKTQSYIERVLGRLGKQGLIVANVDCQVVRETVRHTERPVLTVGLRQPADITATLIERLPSEQTFLVDAGGDSSVVRTRIVGDSHIYASLLTVAAGSALGLDLDSIVRGIESIESIPGRLERVECGQQFSVFVDGSPKPEDLKRTLRTLREVTPGKLICVCGEGEAEYADLRWHRGRVTERFADLQIITSDDPTDSRPLRTAHDLLDGFRHPALAHVLPNRVRAIEWALAEAQSGDTVLLAGPHNRRLLRSKTEYLPDAEVARYWLFESSQDSTEWIFADR